MALSILSNTAATKAAFAMNSNNVQLNKSLNRLSSGKQIVTPADDAGGLAVSMKLGSSIARNKSIVANIQNAMSFGEVQDGALSSAAKIVDRMAELTALSLDVMKSTTDVANYSTEFKALQNQLFDLTSEKFNGVSLFNSSSSKTFGDDVDNMEVITSDQGGAGAKVSMSKGLLLGAMTFTSFTDTSAGEVGDQVSSLLPMQVEVRLALLHLLRIVHSRFRSLRRLLKILLLFEPPVPQAWPDCNLRKIM